MVYEVNACRDAPDDNDILFWAVADTERIVPERVFYKTATIYNQWAQPTTKMGCWSYGMVHCTNTVNDIDIRGKQYEPIEYRLWFVDTYETANYNPIVKGSSLQDQLNYARKQQLIEWYVKLDKLNKEEYQTNLAEKRVLYTWSSNINWKKTRDSKDKYAVVEKWAGHIFAITGYGKKWLVCLNSYWPNYMDWGYFYIRWEDIGCLFSVYALVDHKDYRTMEQWKAKRAENKPILDRFAKIREKYK